MDKIKIEKSGITTKFLVPLADGYASEVTLVERTGKTIICFSTMVGCPVGCKFCYSGVADLYKRPLTADEMVSMINVAYEALTNFTPNRIIFSAMGEGEPALNTVELDKVFDYLKLMHVKDDNDTIDVRFAISTTAPTLKGLYALIDLWEKHKERMKLQYSFHSVLSRKLLMRGAKVDPREVLSALSINAVKCELNFTLIKGVNDSDEDLERIYAALVFAGGNWKLKLNYFNPVSIAPELEAADLLTYKYFASMFQTLGYEVEEYMTDGRDIGAACGQLHYQQIT